MSKDDGERMADELRVVALKRIADIRSDANARIAVIRAEAENRRAGVMREFEAQLTELWVKYPPRQPPAATPVRVRVVRKNLR